MNLCISERLMYTTVRIECLYKDESYGTGTGFFFNFLEEGHRSVPCIVTNKHAVGGSKQG